MSRFSEIYKLRLPAYFHHNSPVDISKTGDKHTHLEQYNYVIWSEMTEQNHKCERVRDTADMCVPTADDY